MIGITEEDMKYFRHAFDLIVDFFYSNDKVFQLLNTKNFEEFTAKIK